MDTRTKPAASAPEQAWHGFEPGAWTTRVNVRDFIQRSYTPYEGDGSFLAGATERTKKVWATLTPLLLDERKKGVLAVSHEPSTITAHSPGYIDRKLELIVGLQTDAPLKRAIMPKGGWRVVEDSLTGYDLPYDQNVKKILTKYAKTHNDGVFDAYTPAMRAVCSGGIVTGLPDAYGRGRIIGDYRRLALYGLDFLIEARRQQRAEIDRKSRRYSCGDSSSSAVR